MISELTAVMALSRVPGVGIRRFLNLVSGFSSARAVLEALPEALCGIEGINPHLADLIRTKADFSYPEKEIRKADAADVDIIAFTDPRYPSRLKQIYDPPFYLYVKGDPARLEESLIAVVGTRDATPYGKSVTEVIVRGLSRAGVGIVSGLALGIDATAHTTALREGGFTAAVLGSGMDVAYPHENAGLFHQIGLKGLLLTEFPFGTPPDRQNFPRRNRIISGISQGVLVVEAGEKSGALITSSFAAEQGVDVFAVPGNITSEKSVGANALIRDGAAPCLCAEDILMRLGKRAPAAAPEKGAALSAGEQQLLSLLESGPLHIDDLLRASGEEPGALHSLLISLQMKGAIRNLPGMRYARAE